MAGGTAAAGGGAAGWSLPCRLRGREARGGGGGGAAVHRPPAAENRLPLPASQELDQW